MKRVIQIFFFLLIFINLGYTQTSTFTQTPTNTIQTHTPTLTNTIQTPTITNTIMTLTPTNTIKTFTPTITNTIKTFTATETFTITDTPTFTHTFTQTQTFTKTNTCTFLTTPTNFPCNDVYTEGFENIPTPNLTCGDEGHTLQVEENYPNAYAGNNSFILQKSGNQQAISVWYFSVIPGHSYKIECQAYSHSYSTQSKIYGGVDNTLCNIGTCYTVGSIPNQIEISPSALGVWQEKTISNSFLATESQICVYLAIKNIFANDKFAIDNVTLEDLDYVCTPTFTETFTQTNTPTMTNTIMTYTPTQTFTDTFTQTNTPTMTNTIMTYTPTQTFTLTDTFTITNTPTITNTIMTYTPTQTFTDTFTITPTFTNTQTFTATNTFTNTNTFTPTQTFTITPTFTVTETLTSTPVNTPNSTTVEEWASHRVHQWLLGENLGGNGYTKTVLHDGLLSQKQKTIMYQTTGSVSLQIDIYENGNLILSYTKIHSSAGWHQIDTTRSMKSITVKYTISTGNIKQMILFIPR